MSPRAGLRVALVNEITDRYVVAGMSRYRRCSLVVLHVQRWQKSAKLRGAAGHDRDGLRQALPSFTVWVRNSRAGEEGVKA